nr:hypothetical protein [Nitrososphaeria archaeon]NIN51780.1 hypothetical protein [Nitrososphaeria archaeon]NIQ32298.1 hypothetical protein [Nitrososphaeria archaeon]
ETCFHNEIEHGFFLEKRWNERIVTEILEHLKDSKIFKVKEDAGEDSIQVVNALTELLPPPSPEWMEWLASIIDAMSSHPIDKVVTTEGPGVYLASLVASRRGKSLAVASRKQFPETEETEFTAGFFEHGDRTHYIYGVYTNERVLLVENNISTGKALASMLESLQGLDVKLKEVICLIGRPDHEGKEVIKQETGVNVKTLFDLSVKEGRIDVGISPEMSDYFQSLI